MPQMPKYQQKFTYNKNEEDLKLNEKKKRQSIEANTNMTEMLELTDKDFKAVIIKMLQGTTRNTLETNEKKKKNTV